MVSKNAIQRKHCVDEKLKDIKKIMMENNTVRLRGIGTGISEASKRVPILPFATQRGKQESSYFRQGN